MASPVIYNALSSQNPTKKKTYNGLADSMLGTNPQFNQGIPSTPKLPQNYGFNDLAGYEEQRRSALGGQFQNQINQARTGIESQYGTALKGYQDTSAQRRAALASSLTDQAQKNFQLQNPGILEDLNSRGVFSSPTAVAQAQAQAMKELELANQSKLTDFDAQQRAYEDELNKNRLNELNQLSLAGTSANIQSQQDALDAGLDLRRGGLEATRQDAAASREEAMARDLAKQQQRNQLTNSLIGVGGSLAGAALPSLLGRGGGGGGFFGGGGGGSSLFGLGAGATATGVATPGVAAGSTLFPGGIGAVGTGSTSATGAGGAAGIGLGSLAAGGAGYYGATKISPASQKGDQASMNVGGAIGGVGGAVFGGPAGAALGSAVGTLAGKASNRLVTGIDDKLGNTAGSIARYSNVLTGAPAVYNKAKELIKDPKQTIARSLGGGSHTDTKGSDAWAVNMDPNEYAQKLGTPGYGVSFDSNQKGSAENRLNAAVSALSPAQLVARYSSGNDGQRTAADRRFKKIYDQGVQMVGRPITPDEMESLLNMQVA